MVNATQTSATPTAPTLIPRDDLLRGSVCAIDNEIHRATSLLDYMEKHGDDDACAVVEMMRPFFDKLGEQADDMRLVLHAN